MVALTPAEFDGDFYSYIATFEMCHVFKFFYVFLAGNMNVLARVVS